jgi:hypothetical protein
MSFAYNASCILRVIRQKENNISSFTFTDALGTELSHHGHLVKLDMIKLMVESQLERYNRLLRQELFFGEEIPSHFIPDIAIEKLVDDVQNRSTGYTFIEDPRNGFSDYKDAYGVWLLSDEGRRKRFMYDNGTTLVWKPQPAIEIIKSFKSLDLELAAGVIFSAGPSSRASEFSRHLFRRMPGATQNLGLVLHNVSLNATTDKTSHQRMVDRFVPHIPTREWALVLLPFCHLPSIYRISGRASL